MRANVQPKLIKQYIRLRPLDGLQDSGGADVEIEPHTRPLDSRDGDRGARLDSPVAVNEIHMTTEYVAARLCAILPHLPCNHRPGMSQTVVLMMHW